MYSSSHSDDQMEAAEFSQFGALDAEDISSLGQDVALPEIDAVHLSSIHLQLPNTLPLHPVHVPPTTPTGPNPSSSTQLPKIWQTQGPPPQKFLQSVRTKPPRAATTKMVSHQLSSSHSTPPLSSSLSTPPLSPSLPPSTAIATSRPNPLSSLTNPASLNRDPSTAPAAHTQPILTVHQMASSTPPSLSLPHPSLSTTRENPSELILKTWKKSSLEMLRELIDNILKQAESGSLTLPSTDSFSSRSRGSMESIVRYINTINYLGQENARLTEENNRLRAHVSNVMSNASNSSQNNFLNPITAKERPQTPGTPIGDKFVGFRNAPLLSPVQVQMAVPVSVPEKKEDDKRPYVCNVEGCTKSFVKASRLKRHRITHDRFYCNKEECNRSYGTKYDLIAHQKLKHGKGSKPFRCTFGECSLAFATKRESDIHRVEHLKNMKFNQLVFALCGTLSKRKAEFTKLINEHGAQVSSCITQKVTHLITTSQDIFQNTTMVKEAKRRGIFIVSEQFVLKSIELGHKADEAEFSLSDHLDFATNSSSTTQQDENENENERKRKEFEDGSDADDEQRDTEDDGSSLEDSSRHKKRRKDVEEIHELEHVQNEHVQNGASSEEFHSEKQSEQTINLEEVSTIVEL